MRALGFEEASRRASQDSERRRVELEAARLDQAGLLREHKALRREYDALANARQQDGERAAQDRRERDQLAAHAALVQDELERHWRLLGTSRVRLGLRLGAISDSARRAVTGR